MDGYEWGDDEEEAAVILVERCSLCGLIRPVRKFGSQMICKGCWTDVHYDADTERRQ